MISDLTDENNRYMRLSDDEEDEQVKVSKPDITTNQESAEYSDKLDGYWTRELFKLPDGNCLCNY